MPPASPNTIREKLLEYAAQIKNEISISLGSNNTRYNLIFDEWTSRSNKRFLNLIARISDSEYNLGLIEVDEAASSENLTTLIY